MALPRIAILLAPLVLGVLFVGVAATAGTPEPVVTLENEDGVTYHVTAYTVADQHAAGYLNFEVTTDDGDRRLVTYADLVWPREHRNVTLADEGVTSQSFVVGPTETITKPISGWTNGDITVYIIERGEDRIHVGSHVVTCDRRGQEHTIGVTEGSGGTRSSVCTGGIDWLFR